MNTTRTLNLRKQWHVSEAWCSVQGICRYLLPISLCPFLKFERSRYVELGNSNQINPGDDVLRLAADFLS
jgi:hypothetical protein